MAEYISNGESALSIRNKLNNGLITPAKFFHSEKNVNITTSDNAKYIGFIATVDYDDSYTYKLNNRAVKIKGASSDISYLWRNGDYVFGVVDKNEIFVFSYLQSAESVITKKTERIKYDNVQENLENLFDMNSTIILSYPVANGQTVNPGDVVDILNGEVLSEYKKNNTTAGDLSIGASIEVKEGGKTARYLVVHQGKPSSMYDDSCDGTWIMREHCLEQTRAFDAENINKLNGSDISEWLESTFFSTIDSEIKNKIKNVKIPYRQGGLNGTDYSGNEGLQCHCFLPSMYELGLVKDDPGFSYSNGTPIDGAKLSYFLSGAESLSNNKRRAEATGASAVSYFTRSPYTVLTTDVWYIKTDGSPGLSRADAASYIRPIFILEKDYIVSSVNMGSTSQAIALQSGSAGDTIPVIFSGVTQLSGVTHGQKIVSPGVVGYAAMNGQLSVFPYWFSSNKVITGSYSGTGAHGSSSPTTVVVNLTKVIAFGVFAYKNNASFSPVWNVVPVLDMGDGESHSVTFYESLGGRSGLVDFVCSGNTMSWFSNNDSGLQMNQSGYTYYWVAFGY